MPSRVEDETGISNLVVFKDLFQKYRKEIIHSRLLMVEGKVQKEGEVIHIVVKHCYNLSSLLTPISQADEKVSADLTTDVSKSDSRTHKKANTTKSIQQDIFHGGRNFH